MSGNGSYIKSMNGIVSFNTGSTIIEGTGITTDTIDCDTINAVTANISSTINTSTIYTDFLVNAANAYITMVGDVKYNNNLYVDNIYSNLTSIINLNNTLKITRLDSITPTASMQVLTSHTGVINMGGDASVFRLGSVSTPVRCVYVPNSGSDLCNKDYVDSAVSGSSLLSTNNIWTGASNTFDNILNVSTMTIFGKASMVFTGSQDYNIVSGDINNVFMVVVNGGTVRTVQMPARKIGQIILLRSITPPGVNANISVSLISGGNFYNPGVVTAATTYTLGSGQTVSYLDNGQNWVSF